MKSEIIFLSPMHAENPIFIQSPITKILRLYHLPPIRYIFEKFQNKKKGAIINEDEGMNFPLQICAFLSAVRESISLEKPAVIYGNDKSLLAWHYYLVEYCGFDVATKIKDREKLVFLLPHSIQRDVNIKILNHSFSFVIIEDYDSIAGKIAFGSISGAFNIGLTTRNFFQNPDRRIQWKMIKWIDEDIGTFDSFNEQCDEYLRRFIEPFTDVWFTLNWIYSDKYEKPSREEIMNQEEILRKWKQQHKLSFEQPESSKQSIKRTNRKATSGTEETTAKRKIVEVEEKQRQLPNTPDEKNIVDESVIDLLESECEIMIAEEINDKEEESILSKFF